MRQKIFLNKHLFSRGNLRFLALIIFAIFANITTSYAEKFTPKKIISFDLCVDQLLLDIAPLDKIAAVTFLSRDENYSFHAEKAQRVGVTNGSIEDAFKYKADLVLVGAFETRAKIDLLRRLGFRVEVIPLAFEPEFLAHSITLLGEVTGHEKRAAEINTAFYADIANLEKSISLKGAQPRAIHLAARRHTQGANSVVNTLFTLAGYRNMALETGNAEGGYIGLETLLRTKPDLMVISKADGEGYSRAADALNHPALQKLLGHTRLAHIHQKYLLCLTPQITQAADKIQKLRNEARP